MGRKERAGKWGRGREGREGGRAGGGRGGRKGKQVPWDREARQGLHSRPGQHPEASRNDILPLSPAGCCLTTFLWDAPQVTRAGVATLHPSGHTSFQRPRSRGLCMASPFLHLRAGEGPRLHSLGLAGHGLLPRPRLFPAPVAAVTDTHRGWFHGWPHVANTPYLKLCFSQVVSRLSRSPLKTGIAGHVDVWVMFFSDACSASRLGSHPRLTLLQTPLENQPFGRGSVETGRSSSTGPGLQLRHLQMRVPAPRPGVWARSGRRPPPAPVPLLVTDRAPHRVLEHPVCELAPL